jgi:glycosidase
MLGGDRRRIELAHSLQLTMPGTPVIRYGEEIGMGDYLDPRTGGNPHADAVGQHPGRRFFPR